MLRAIRLEERKFRDSLPHSFTTQEFLSACQSLKIDERLKAKLHAKPYLVRRVIHDVIEAGLLPDYVDLNGKRYSPIKNKCLPE